MVGTSPTGGYGAALSRHCLEIIHLMLSDFYSLQHTSSKLYSSWWQANVWWSEAKIKKFETISLTFLVFRTIVFFYFFEFQNVTDIDQMHVQFKYIRCVALRTFTVSLAAKQTQIIFTSSRNSVWMNTQTHYKGLVFGSNKLMHEATNWCMKQ